MTWPDPTIEHAVVGEAAQGGAQVRDGARRRAAAAPRAARPARRRPGTSTCSGTHAPWSRPRQPSMPAVMAGGLQQRRGRLRELGGARRIVANRVELVRKAAEVVDGRELARAGQHRQRSLPVRGHHQDRLRARKRLRERAPGAAGVGCGERVHRRAVGDEQRGQAGHGAVCLVRFGWEAPRARVSAPGKSRRTQLRCRLRGQRVGAFAEQRLHDEASPSRTPGTPSRRPWRENSQPLPTCAQVAPSRIGTSASATARTCTPSTSRMPPTSSAAKIDVAEEAGQAHRAEELRGSGQGEDEELEQCVGDEHHAQRDAQDQGGERGLIR